MQVQAKAKAQVQAQVPVQVQVRVQAQARVQMEVRAQVQVQAQARVQVQVQAPAQVQVQVQVHVRVRARVPPRMAVSHRASALAFVVAVQVRKPESEVPDAVRLGEYNCHKERASTLRTAPLLLLRPLQFLVPHRRHCCLLEETLTL